ncbi:MAG: ribonuclease III [Rhizobiaceae bacterium]|nr:ribonuclease III [Rhizobiaceae bacterium]
MERGRKRFGNLESRLGYQFSKYANIERALTHASVRKKSDDHFQYERLEFLGDRVLGLIVAQMLFENFPEANEGELSLRLNSLVNGKTLARISDELALHEFIRTGGDLKQLTGRRMENVRADVLEAIIASVFLDGGLKAANDFIDRFWGTRLYDDAAARRDSKTELQEWSHAKKLGTPKYREKSRSGPDHDPIFTVAVYVDGRKETEGVGSSKRIAEQDAAGKMLLQEGVWNAEDAIH